MRRFPKWNAPTMIVTGEFVSAVLLVEHPVPDF
jgi:hypothetical protein